MEITADVFDISNEFPKHEMYGLANQMNRASISMASNIAEGSTRGDRHFKLFLNTSLGSSFELQTQLLIARQRHYITDNQSDILELKITEFQKMTSGLIEKFESTTKS